MNKLRSLTKFIKFTKIEKRVKTRSLQFEIFKKDAHKIIERNEKSTKKLSKLTGKMKIAEQKETDFYGLELNLALFTEHYKEESLYIKTIMDFYKIDYLLV